MSWSDYGFDNIIFSPTWKLMRGLYIELYKRTKAPRGTSLAVDNVLNKAYIPEPFTFANFYSTYSNDVGIHGPINQNSHPLVVFDQLLFYYFYQFVNPTTINKDATPWYRKYTWEDVIEILGEKYESVGGIIPPLYNYGGFTPHFGAIWLEQRKDILELMNVSETPWKVTGKSGFKSYQMMYAANENSNWDTDVTRYTVHEIIDKYIGQLTPFVNYNGLPSNSTNINLWDGIIYQYGQYSMFYRIYFWGTFIDSLYPVCPWYNVGGSSMYILGKWGNETDTWGGLSTPGESVMYTSPLDWSGNRHPDDNPLLKAEFAYPVVDDVYLAWDYSVGLYPFDCLVDFTEFFTGGPSEEELTAEPVYAL